jgi:hypothetical protein
MFWQPSQQQYLTIQRLILTPLRRSIQLPPCTKHLALLDEYGILQPSQQRHAQLLSYFQRASRMQQFCPKNPIYAILFDTATPDLTNVNSRSFRPAAEALALQHIYQYDYATSTLTPKQIILNSAHQAYISSAPSTQSLGLRAVKSTPGCSQYIKYCDKQQACLIALYRHDFARFACSVIQFRINAAVPNHALTPCALCHTANDSRDHAVTSCISLVADRHTATIQLASQLRSTPCLRNLLADLNESDLPKSKLHNRSIMTDIMSTIHAFLKQIHTLRFTFDPP